MLDLLQTGKYGVLTQQKLLNTTSNNITNVNTVGYTRQETLVYTSAIDWGVGSTVTRRLYDKYVQREMFRDQGNVGFYDAYASGLSTVDNLLSKEDTSLSTQIDNLFSSMEEAVQNTTSIANRRELLTQFQNLVDRYNTLNYNIKNELNDINSKIGDTATTINDLVKGIYEINRQVRNLTDKGEQSDIGLQLIDKRDQLIDELSNYVDINVTTESDGSYSLYLGNGQLLVNADTYAQLDVKKDDADPTRRSIDLVFEVPAKTRLETAASSWGGKLGGLMAASNEMRQSMRELGQNAIALADALNQQNKGGITLEGVSGGDLIKIPDVNAVASSTGYGMTLTFNEGEGADVRSCDYRIDWDGADERGGTPRVFMIDANGNETEVPEDDIKVTLDGNNIPAVKLEGHGVTLNFKNDVNDMIANKIEFKVQPTINAAYDVKCNIAKPEDFAFASAVRVKGEGHAGNAVPELVGMTNIGENYGVSIGADGKPVFNAGAPVKIEFQGDGKTGEYVIFDSEGNRLGAAPADCEGRNIFANATWDIPAGKPEGYPGYDVNFTGTVVNGSSFTIEINTDGYNDNSNGNILAGKKQEGLVYSTDSVKTTFTEDYADLTSAVGSAVMSATTDLKAAMAKCEQSQNLFSSTAGVNLDEEAANLIRYQQSYSACARIINASQTIFDALMNAI